MGARRLGLGFLLGASIVAACSSTDDASESTKKDIGEICASDADCLSGVCSFHQCRKPCTRADDCAPGPVLCVDDGTGRHVCILSVCDGSSCDPPKDAAPDVAREAAPN